MSGNDKRPGLHQRPDLPLESDTALSELNGGFHNYTNYWCPRALTHFCSKHLQITQTTNFWHAAQTVISPNRGTC